MRHFNGKALILCLICCCTAILTPSTASAAPEDQITHPSAFDRIGINRLKQIDPNLTGEGVNFALISRSITYLDGEPQNDYRPAIRHDSLSDADFRFFDDGLLPGAVSPHSTAICSILFGTDPNAFTPKFGKFNCLGAVPEATGDIYEFWHFVRNNIFTQTPPDAMILTADLGTQFSDWWTRGIESMVDSHGLIVIAGIGNGTQAYDPVLYPGAGSNVIGVGVVNSVNASNPITSLTNFALPDPQHSSLGPTDDGRCKPDIVAPGNCIAADTNDSNSYQNTGDWSSFSTPIVAGTVGLLIQKAQQDPNLAEAINLKGRNSTVKAILLNSAEKLPYWHKGKITKDDDHLVPLDYIQGAGMLDAFAAYQLLTSGRAEPNDVPNSGWDNNLLDTENSPQNTYRITIPEDQNDSLLTATLAWNNHYSPAYPFDADIEQDSDLRLELWAIDTNDPNNDYLLDYSDSRYDNLEHIHHLIDPNYTTYEIIVTHTPEAEPPTAQRYGLAWNLNPAIDNDNILWYDLNADGFVDDSDFMIISENWLTAMLDPSKPHLTGDINADGRIDINDINILSANKNRRSTWFQE